MKRIISLFLSVAFIKFVIIGVVNTVIDGSFFSIFNWFGMYYLISKILSYIITVSFSYIINSLWTYRVKLSWKKYFLFPLSSIPGLFIQLVGLYVMVEYIGLGETISWLIGVIISIPLSYLIARFVLHDTHAEQHILES